MKYLLIGMYADVFMELGLSPNEAKIYESLLNTDSATVSTIAVKAKVHRRNVYDSMNKLIEKGLVSQLVLENEKHFRAINPNRLSGIIKDKEMKLDNIMPELQQKFLKVDSKEQSYVYKGVQGFRNYMQDVLDAGKPVYCIGAKGGWWDPRFKHFRIRFYNEIEKRKLIGPEIFDHDMQFKMPDVIKSHKHQCKFFPKKYDTNSAIDFFGDQVVIFTGLNEYGRLDDDITLFVIKSKPIAESMKIWFQMIWDLLPEPDWDKIRRI